MVRVEKGVWMTRAILPRGVVGRNPETKYQTNTSSGLRITSQWAVSRSTVPLDNWFMLKRNSYVYAVYRRVGGSTQKQKSIPNKFHSSCFFFFLLFSSHASSRLSVCFFFFLLVTGHDVSFFKQGEVSIYKYNVDFGYEDDRFFFVRPFCDDSKPHRPSLFNFSYALRFWLDELKA
jgi:hypothetical protein